MRFLECGVLFAVASLLEVERRCCESAMIYEVVGAEEDMGTQV